MRKKSHESLQKPDIDSARATEEICSDLVERANDGIVVIQDRVLKLVNPAFASTLGYAREDLLGRCFLDLVPQDLLPFVADMHTRRLAGEDVPQMYDAAMLTKDGERLDAEVNASLITYRGAPAVSVIMRDVSERRRAEEELRQSEERYRLLADNLTDVIFTMDFDGRYTYISPSIERLRGYTVEEALRENLADRLTPASLEIAQKRLNEARLYGSGHIPTAPPPTLELEHCCKDGTTIWTEINASLMMGADGKPSGIMGVTRDISERRRSEAELQKHVEKVDAQYERLKSITEQKARFFMNMSHELRTPMTSIVGFIELVMDDIETPLAPGHRELLGKVSQNAYRLLGMVNDLLDLSRAESQNLTASIAEVNVNHVVERLVGNMLTLTGDKQIQLTYSGSPALNSVYTDEDKLSQIVVNLIANAIKFTQSGTVTVTADVVNHEIVISVRDTGVGMDSADLDKIFDEFYTGVGPRKGIAPGTGLGLAIAKKLCEFLGGTISVISELGNGSTFTVHIRDRQPPAD